MFYFREPDEGGGVNKHMPNVLTKLARSKKLEIQYVLIFRKTY